MRLNKRNCWSLLALMFALLIAVPGDAFAKPGGRSGGSRRSKPSVKRTAPKTKAKTKRGGNTGGASKKAKFGSSKKKAGKSKKATAADKKAYEKAKANGTTFKDRKSAATDFKKKNAAKYGSSYATKPATRPGHIPQSYASGGTTYNISYHQGYGGYGYMGPLGSWIAYNAMADMAMAPYYNRQMASAGYYYGPPPRYGYGTGTIILFILAGAFLIGLFFAMLRKGSSV